MTVLKLLISQSYTLTKFLKLIMRKVPRIESTYFAIGEIPAKSKLIINWNFIIYFHCAQLMQGQTIKPRNQEESYNLQVYFCEKQLQLLFLGVQNGV